MLTNRELKQLRSDVLETLPDTCRIERAVTTNINGYPDEAWGTAVVNAPCRIDPDTTRRDFETVADREAGVARYVLTMRYNEDIQDGDRIYLTSDGKYYGLLELHEAHSDRIVRRGRVSQIRGG